VFLRSASIFNC